jgi:hypothetical protein
MIPFNKSPYDVFHHNKLIRGLLTAAECATLEPFSVYNFSLWGHQEFTSIDVEIVGNNGVAVQRGLVWTLAQKRRLILSLVNGVIVPPITVVTNPKTFETLVVDGKQRLTTVWSFLRDEFSITVDGEEYFFSEFSKKEKSVFLELTLGVIEYRGRDIPHSWVQNMYNLMNYAGTAHE